MPNDGTKIYSQTINGVPYGVDVYSDVYKVLGLTKYNGTWDDVAYACNNSHGKINKCSAMKPYRFGQPFLELDRDTAKANNFGMTPVLLMTGQSAGHELDTPVWGQWQHPTNSDYSRITDFDGYYHGAKEHIVSVKLHTSLGQNHTQPVLGTTGGDPNKVAKIIGEVETRSIDNGSIHLDEFKYNGAYPINAWRLTLILGAYVQGTVLENAWTVQGPRADEMRDGLFTVEMVTTDNQSMLNSIENDSYGHTVMILCLAPEIAGATQGIVNEVPSQMLSLNMWSNKFTQIIHNDSYAQPSVPEPEEVYPIFGDVDYYGTYISGGSMSFINDDREVVFRVSPTVTVDISADEHKYNFNGVTGELLAHFVLSKVDSTDDDIHVHDVPVTTFQFVNYKTQLYGGYSVRYQDIIDRARVQLTDGRYFVRCYFTMEMHMIVPAISTDYYLCLSGNDEVEEDMRDFGFSNLADERGGLFCFPGYAEQRQIYWNGL